MKFTAFINDEDVVPGGSDRYEIKTCSDGTECALIRIPTGPIKFIRKMAEALPDEVIVLYVHKVPRTEAWELGRYQSPPLTQDQALQFLDRFGDFFEGDGRHDLWIYWPKYIQLVYDNHERIYLYGHIPSIEAKLAQLGVTKEPVGEIDFPHKHHYNPEFDAALDDLMQAFEWKMSPLQESDDD